MTYKQLETWREIRLWVGQIIVPAAALTIASPKARQFLKEKTVVAKNAIKQKLSK